jgi:hypothetical protein
LLLYKRAVSSPTGANEDHYGFASVNNEKKTLALQNNIDNEKVKENVMTIEELVNDFARENEE